MLYNLSNQDGTTTLTVFGSDGYSKVVPNTHPYFTQVLTYLTTTEPHDEQHVKDLLDPAIAIGKALAEHFGDRLEFDLYTLRLDGQKLDGPLASLVKSRIQSGDADWVRFAKFLVNLDNNPSYHAKAALWSWVEKNGLTITEDGRFLGYKAVENDGFSKSSGPNNYVDGVLYRDGESARVPHQVGSVISKKRSDVDDKPGGGCSVGLHVGTLKYAQGFAPRLLTVAVDPGDVVSVPSSDLEYKIRVCKYEVISMADPAQFATTSYNLSEAERETLPMKSDERVAIETAIRHLSEYRRKAYDQARAYSATHEQALAHAESIPRYRPEESASKPVAVVDTEFVPEGRQALVVARFPDVSFAEQFLASLDDQEKVERGAYAIDAPEPEVEETMEQHEARVREDAAAGRWETEETAKPLSYYAERYEELRKDLEDRSLGHKPLARKYEWLTTEASVRRYRKSNGITLKVAAKVKDAVS